MLNMEKDKPHGIMIAMIPAVTVTAEAVAD